MVVKPLLLSILLAGIVGAQRPGLCPKGALTEAQVLNQIESGVSEDRIVLFVTSCRVDFPPLPATIKRLTDKGASLRLTEVIRQSYNAPVTPTQDGKVDETSDLPAMQPVIPQPQPEELPKSRVPQLKVNAADGLRYVWIAPGTFTGYNNQRFTVSGYWLGQTPVTQAAYMHVIGRNPSTFKGDNRPVETVNWNEAAHYCDAVGGRLPTDAEWEFAARAGVTGDQYPELDRFAWIGENSSGTTHDVRQREPNAWGLYDMLGNVSEWIYDWVTFERSDILRDPKGPTTGKYKEIRGCPYTGIPMVCRLGSRGGNEPEAVRNGVGFRCVLE